jgi:glycosyltransferase involved in cell wall biosynthesis
VHPPLVLLCYTGRRELAAYPARVEIALGDSEFNRQELESMGFPATGVLPVVPGFSHLEVTSNRFVAGAFDDDRTNILFVGRVIPNKKFEDLIRILHAYRRHHNANARLLLVGSHAGFEKYLASLHHLARRLRVRDVHFIGHVSNEELTAYYDVADVFLCASEHEGFCVPLVEAFYKGVPVVAYAATAVPATMDGAGVLYENRDPDHVAALVHAVVSDEEHRRRVVEGQDGALERLRRRAFDRTLVGFVERVLRSPLRPAVPVPDAFWHEVRTVELRKLRPALNMALPGREAGVR